MGGAPVSDTELTVQIAGHDIGGELNSLYGWFSGESALRARVRLEAGPPEAGTMGAGLAQLIISIGSGGVAPAFAATLIAWIRSRSGAISVELSLRGRRVMRLDAKKVQALTHEQVYELADRISAMLPPDDEQADGGPHR